MNENDKRTMLLNDMKKRELEPFKTTIEDIYELYKLGYVYEAVTKALFLPDVMSKFISDNTHEVSYTDWLSKYVLSDYDEERDILVEKNKDINNIVYHNHFSSDELAYIIYKVRCACVHDMQMSHINFHADKLSFVRKGIAQLDEWDGRQKGTVEEKATNEYHVEIIPNIEFIDKYRDIINSDYSFHSILESTHKESDSQAISNVFKVRLNSWTLIDAICKSAVQQYDEVKKATDQLDEALDSSKYDALMTYLNEYIK